MRRGRCYRCGAQVYAEHDPEHGFHVIQCRIGHVLGYEAGRQCILIRRGQEISPKPLSYTHGHTRCLIVAD